MTVPAQVLAAVRSIPHPRQETPMTMPLSEFTEAQAARLASIEAADPAPESLRERVLQAAHAAACNCGDEDPAASTYWQRIADAAVAVMRGER